MRPARAYLRARRMSRSSGTLLAISLRMSFDLYDERKGEDVLPISFMYVFMGVTVVGSVVTLVLVNTVCRKKR